MIPLSDENPTRTFPVITILLIAACVGIWVLVQGGGLREDSDDFTFRTAAIPCEVVKGRPLNLEELVTTLRGDTEACTDSGETPDDPACIARATTTGRELICTNPGKQVYLAVLYSMFLHGGWLHLGFNMLFLWVFGNNIEDKRGKVTYIAFYLVAGLIATLAHVAVQPNSSVPLVGASGAIAGVMGAYLVLYPNVRIRSLVFLGFFITFVEVRAKWLLGIWFVLQFFTNPAEGVAWVAHVGGFVFGVLVGIVWRATSRPQPQPDQIPWRPSY